MVKEMRSDLNPFSLSKHNSVIIKFAVSFLLVGLAFRLLISGSFRFSSVVETSVPANEETKPESLMASLPEEPASNNFEANKSQNSQSGKCDLFTGEWIPDPSGPFYTNQSCLQIEGHQNCMKNGRPDSGYLYWRWSPRGCSLPKFNPKKFLHLMRNKSWAFIGDSISRNHVQSLLCILSQFEVVMVKDTLHLLQEHVEDSESSAAALGPDKGVVLKLLDTTRLSLLRPDGHPGPYRQFQPFAEDKNAKVQNDCLHWCLPGPIDSWNDLVMEMIVNGVIYQ